MCHDPQRRSLKAPVRCFSLYEQKQTGTLLPTTLAPRVSHFKLVDLPTPSRTVDSQAGHRPDDAKPVPKMSGYDGYGEI